MFSKSNLNRRAIIILVAVVALVGLAIWAGSGHQAKKPTSNPANNEVSPPLVDQLPVQTPHYKIEYNYDQTSKKFTYLITLYAILNRPSDYPDYQQQLKQYKQEALDWIKVRGQDPTKLSISYEPSQATDL